MEGIVFDGTWSGWSAAARSALARGISPEIASWRDSRETQSALVWSENLVEESAAPEQMRFRVPRRFLALGEAVSCFRDGERWALLYRVLWRLTHGEPHLLDVAVDADVRSMAAMVKAVHHATHKMRAFVRFREVATSDGPWFVAWFEPPHEVVERNAEFFRDRFAAMKWSILTPERCMHWDRQTLRLTEGLDRSKAPKNDQVEDLWRTYYSSIFNPARVSVRAMEAQMARSYWPNLPEAHLIPSLVAGAPKRVETMIAASQEKRPLADDGGRASPPPSDDFKVLREAATQCRACPLWKNATCTVFGEGPAKARVFIVGEQPGDQEDRAGRPFVGPAGKLLDRALLAAGLDRNEFYLTNAVKHFKWTPQGKRRLHAKPGAREISACRPWLEAEIRAGQPTLLVCLGATAARAVLGTEIKIGQDRSKTFDTEFGLPALITVHPSALLRLPEGADPEVEFARFVADLKNISRLLGKNDA